MWPVRKVCRYDLFDAGYGQVHSQKRKSPPALEYFIRLTTAISLSYPCALNRIRWDLAGRW